LIRTSLRPWIEGPAAVTLSSAGRGAHTRAQACGLKLIQPKACASWRDFTLHGQLPVTVRAVAPCTAGLPLWLSGAVTLKTARVTLFDASFIRRVIE
jgi:hypothetical protein